MCNDGSRCFATLYSGLHTSSYITYLPCKRVGRKTNSNFQLRLFIIHRYLTEIRRLECIPNDSYSNIAVLVDCTSLSFLCVTTFDNAIVFYLEQSIV